MADNKVVYRIDIKDDGSSTLNRVGENAEKADGKVGRLTNSLGKLGMASLGIQALTTAFSKLWSVMESSDAAYRAQIEAETKLEKVMRNTMGATAEDIQAIKDLTSAQQQLGVIGDEVQLAGAKELSMFLKQKDSLAQLIPVMNDVVAQQYGLNATQENAASVADMLGKALNGSTMLLKRYGFSFTEAQEKILKYGDEQQRVAVLSDIVSASVGGMNEEMAQTPAGQMQQYSNAMGDVGERFGELYNRVRTALLPAMFKMVDVLNTMIDGLGALFSFVNDNLDVLTALGVAITAITVAANAHAIAAGISTAATELWTLAQAALNAVMYANPIGLVIAAIAALVAAILWVSKHTEGWGTLWDAILTFMKEGFYTWVAGIKLEFDTLINGLMMGLDKIKEGWYKFKNAVGIGDTAENNRMLQQIASDVEKRKKAIADSAEKVREHAEKARHAFDNVNISWKSNDEKSDADSIKANANTLGLKGGVNIDTKGASSKESATAIASGGTRSTSININFSKEMVKMEFNGGYLDNKDQVESTLAESLLRVLSAAQASI